MIRSLENGSSKITPKNFKKALQILREGAERINKHRQFEAAGGSIRWVVDADICHFFIAPDKNMDKADLFSNLKYRNKKETESLEALTYLLSNFFFSGKLQISEKIQVPQLMILNSHADELHEIIQAIARKAALHGLRSRDFVDGKTKNFIKNLTECYIRGQKNKHLKPKEFVKNLYRIIDEFRDILIPTGPLKQLERASILLKERNLQYQSDIKDAPVEELSTSKVKLNLEELTEMWFNQLQDFYHKNDKQRKIINTYRDAEALASLDYLNKTQSVRYIFITGTTGLDQMTQDLRDSNINHNIHILHPLHFLNNFHLLDTSAFFEPLSETTPNSSGHGKKQMIDALNLLSNVNNDDDALLESQLPELFENWRDLENLTKPYLPENMPEEYANDRKEVLKKIFLGESLDFFEVEIYLTLSQFILSAANLGLTQYYENETPKKIPQRKPPPLLLAKYPIAEGLICDLVERKFWNQEGKFKGQSFTKEINDVKAEQLSLISEEDALSNFNYTLLLCYAARYATLDDWHACRIMAAHAKSVAEVLKDEELRGEVDFITGREAAFLEAYSRRLDARDESDLEKASAALEDFETACVKEKRIDNGENNVIVEFELHALRLKVERICIRFSELAFYCFKEHNLASIEFLLKERQQDWKKLLDECLTTQTKLSEFQSLDTQSRSFVASIKFMSAQLSLCALQCGIFMHRVPNTQCEPKIADPLFLEEIEEHGTEVSILMVSIAKYLWLGSDIEIVNEKIKEHRSALSKKKESQNDRFPHDHGRLIFLESLIGEKNE